MLPVICFGCVLSFFCYGVNDKLVPVASQKLGESRGGGSHFVYIVENTDLFFMSAVSELLKNKSIFGKIFSRSMNSSIKETVIV